MKNYPASVVWPSLFEEFLLGCPDSLLSVVVSGFLLWTHFDEHPRVDDIICPFVPMDENYSITLVLFGAFWQSQFTSHPKGQCISHLVSFLERRKPPFYYVVIDSQCSIEHRVRTLN